VEVYGNDKLHAKVFVFPNCAVVGSNNASRRSANYRIEAAIEATGKGTITACRRFVKSLCQSPPVGPEYLEHLKTLYQPPLGPPVQDDKPVQNPELWVVRVEHIDYDRDDLVAEAQGKPLAEAELSAGRYSVDNFCFSGAIFPRKVARNDSVAQIVCDDGQLLVHPPSRVLHVESYAKADGSKWVMVFVEAADDKEAKDLDAVIWGLKKQGGANCESLRLIQTAKRITDQRTARLFLNVWV
jgi:hypothetical protein